MSATVMALEDLAERIDYGVTASSNTSLAGPKFLRITDIQDCQVHWKTVPYCKISTREQAQCELHKGDIVFARTGATTGKSYLITDCPLGTVFASYLIRVRPLHEQVLPAYLSYFFQTERYWSQITEKSDGSTQPGVNSSKLATLRVPVVPMEEQHRVVGQLDKADRLRRTRRYAQTLSDTFLQSVFLEMFGDPVTNPMGWETSVVDDVCDLVRGSSPRPQGDTRYFIGPVPRLMIGDITRDGMYVTPLIDSLTKLGATKSRPMNAGDVIMAVSGAVGLPTILKTDACIHDGFVGFRNLDTKVSPVYLYFFLKVLRESSSLKSVGAIWQNLTTDDVKNLQIPLPSASLVESFCNVVGRVMRLDRQLGEGARQADHLFQSLLHRAFQSEM